MSAKNWYYSNRGLFAIQSMFGTPVKDKMRKEISQEVK